MSPGVTMEGIFGDRVITDLSNAPYFADMAIRTPRKAHTFDCRHK